MREHIRLAALLSVCMSGSAFAAPITIDAADFVHEHGPACHGVHWISAEGSGVMRPPSAPQNGSSLNASLDLNPNGTSGQTVFVDFAGPETFTVRLQRLDGTRTNYVAPNGRSVFDTWVYSPEQRADVLARMNADYRGFNVKFTDVLPTSGEFTRLEINNPAIRRVTPTTRLPNITITEIDDNGDRAVDRLGFSVLFGLAGGIDFRNKFQADTTFADANLYAFLDQAGLRLNALPVGVPTADFVLAQAALTGSHEVGHVLGLRHHDALGPIGLGVNGRGTVGTPGNWDPDFPGPAAAFATNEHIMASGGSTGRPLNPLGQRAFGVREATKLAFNEQGVNRSEDRLRTVGGETFLTLPNLRLADGTLVTGDESGVADSIASIRLHALTLPELELSDAEGAYYGNGAPRVRAFNVEGRIARPSLTSDGGALHDVDLFALDLQRGAFLSVEALASTPSWAEEPFFPVVGLFDADLNLLRWFDAQAISFRDPESGDPFLMDFRIETGGRYHLGIWSPLNFVDRLTGFGRGEFVSGLYELYVTSYQIAVPAPAAMLLFGAGAVGLLTIRRRR